MRVGNGLLTRARPGPSNAHSGSEGVRTIDLVGRSAGRSAPKWQTEKSKTEKVEAHCPTETMGGGMVVPG
jgi:hypothetical protein